MALEKTEWAAETMVFLGILLDGRNFILSLPLEKRERAEYLLQNMLDRAKATVKELQTLCGFLNFLRKAIFLGRVFTRRMYTKFSKFIDHKARITREYKLKSYHHVRLDAEFKRDCAIWLSFLKSDIKSVVNRPLIDMEETTFAVDIGFTSDVSASEKLGFGSTLGTKWIFRVALTACTCYAFWF